MALVPVNKKVDVAATDKRVTEAQEQQAQQRSNEEAFYRQLGMTGRHIIGGLTKFGTGMYDATVPYQNLVPGREAQYLTPGVDPTLDRMGFPQPENALERIVQEGSEFASSASPYVKAGQLVSRLAPMAANPGQQAVGAITGGVASQGIEEAGGPGWLQFIGNIAGSLAPTLGLDAGRWILRNADDAQAAVQTARRAGYEPTAGDVGRQGLRRIENQLRQYSTGGALEDNLANRADEIRDYLGRRADDTAPPQTTQELGEEIEGSLKTWIRESSEEGGGYYDEVEELMPSKTPVELARTQGTFAQPGALDDAPNTAARLTPKFMQSLETDLAADIAEYTASQGTRNALPYDTVRAVRSKVGKKIDNSVLDPDVDLAQLKQLYRSMSDDLLEGVRQSGDEGALEAALRADSFWKQRMESIDNIRKVVDRVGGPESVYKHLLSGTQDGATKLRQVYGLLDGFAQDSLSAEFVRRMGRAGPGAQGVDGDTFSLNTYLTNWNKMSPEARDVLLGGRTGLVEATEAVAKVADQFKKDMGRYQSKSGSDRGVQFSTWVGSMGAAFGSGQYGALAALASLPIAAALGSKLMLNPKFITWMAKNRQAPVAALPTLVNQLRAYEDEDMNELATLILQGAVPE